MVKERPWKSKKLMHLLYVKRGWSEEKIASYLATDQSTVNRWLRRHELKK